MTATISIDFVRELAVADERAGIDYASAPVLGRPDVAKAGQLNILVDGNRSAVDRARPLLEVLGKKLSDMGEEPARANAAKIAANMMIAMAIEAMAEAVVLTESAGLPRQMFFDLILGTLFGGRAYENYSALIARQEHEAGFKARLGLKDPRLATAVAGIGPRPAHARCSAWPHGRNRRGGDGRQGLVGDGRFHHQPCAAGFR